MPSIEVPVEFPAMAGLFVGGCVSRGDGSRFRRRAHAHTDKTDPHRGWVCVLSERRILTPSARPSKLMWHEYAHITTGHGHDAVWRERITEYGFPAEARRYIRRTGRLAVARSPHDPHTQGVTRVTHGGQP